MFVLEMLGIILLFTIVFILIGILIYILIMQFSYYRIPDKTELKICNPQNAILEIGKTYKATTYNVGFGAYNHDFDFFMDSGELKDGTKTHGHHSKAASKKAVLDSTNGVIQTMKKYNPDFMLFQEIDTNSTRSYHVNQVKMVVDNFKNYDYTFAKNFHTKFLAYPLTDPHGSVQSGLLSLSKYQIKSAIRRQYPITSKFISKFFDLDRCFVMMRYPISNGKELVMINTHMSAYDKGGEMRKKQMDLLTEVMETEYQDGNYVIVGGDFNHALGKDMINQFTNDEKIPNWISVIDQDMMPTGFSIVKAENRMEISTIRSTDRKYDPQVNYQTICDGFFISNNITAKATNIDTDFLYADHNPVEISFKLRQQ